MKDSPDKVKAFLDNERQAGQFRLRQFKGIHNRDQDDQRDRQAKTDRQRCKQRLRQTP